MIKTKLNLLRHLFLPICLDCIVLSVVFRNQAQIQAELLTLAVFIYVAFAMIHHYFDKSLTIETVLEYILIAVLSLIVLTGALNQ